jgi:hypothetical protein
VSAAALLTQPTPRAGRQEVKIPALLSFHERIYERDFSAVRFAVLVPRHEAARRLLCGEARMPAKWLTKLARTRARAGVRTRHQGPLQGADEQVPAGERARGWRCV